MRNKKIPSIFILVLFFISGILSGLIPVVSAADNWPPNPPTLVIDAPDSVNEGAEFTVTVTANDVPVYQADVYLGDCHEQTNGDGEAILTAPMLEGDDPTEGWEITANHPSYRPGEKPITVNQYYKLYIASVYPDEVVEGDLFSVLVKDQENHWLNEASVEVIGYMTLDTWFFGKAFFIAPTYIDENTIYQIRAFKQYYDFIGGSKSILVKNAFLQWGELPGQEQDPPIPDGEYTTVRVLNQDDTGESGVLIDFEHNYAVTNCNGYAYPKAREIDPNDEIWVNINGRRLLKPWYEKVYGSIRVYNDEADATINCYVFNDSSPGKEPIQGAKVRIRSGETKYTGPDGTCSFTVSPQSGGSDYKIIASRSEFETKSIWVRDVMCGEERDVEFPLIWTGEVVESCPITVTATVISIENETVHFEPALSDATDIASAIYHWDFLNGDISADEDPLYRYREPGIYEVELTAIIVMDDISHEYIIEDSTFVTTGNFIPDDLGTP